MKLEPRPWLSAGVCTPHSCDLELEDIGKIPFIKEHLEEKRRTIRFIRGHHYSLFLWRWAGPLREDADEAVRIAEAGDSGAERGKTEEGEDSPGQEKRSVAVIGFCFGGWVVGKLCGDPLFQGRVVCGISTHPAWMLENACHWGRDTDMAERVFCPQLLLPAANDSQRLKPGGEIPGILERRGVPVRAVEIPAKHGFMTRGDEGDGEMRAAQGAAFAEWVVFLEEHLR